MNKDDIKKKKAVALTYKKEDLAPTVVAMGKGYLAEKILNTGANVPIYKNEELVNELLQLDIGLTIPPELYEVVAQILVFISDLDKMAEYRDYE